MLPKKRRGGKKKKPKKNYPLPYISVRITSCTSVSLPLKVMQIK